MFFVMLRILFSTSFVWCWLLVFPVSVGMEWNNNKSGASSFAHAPNFGSSESRDFTGCTTLMGIGGKDNFLQPLFPELEEQEQLRVSVTIDQPSRDKSCGQSTYDQLQKYEQCVGKENIALLPVQSGLEETFIKDVKKEVTLKGSLDYIFDGGTAVRFPNKHLPFDWSRKYTISGWLQVNSGNDRQYIISWSDGDTPHRQNTGFFVQRLDSKSLMFGFTNSHKHQDKLCLLSKKWTIKEDRNNWHFFSLSFYECNVEFSINGVKLTSSSAISHFPAPEKHLQPKFVIGARWAGGVAKYAEYFNGKLSGLMLTVQESFDEKILTCLLECKEKLSLYFNLPSGFKKEDNHGRSITITGSGTMKEFSNILDDILYSNTNRLPWDNKQTVVLEARNTGTNQIARKTITIRSIRPVPKISITGDCGSSEKHKITKPSSVRICQNVKVAMKSCDTVLDSLTIRSVSSLEKSERVFIPAAYINRFGLKMKKLDSGFAIYGTSDFTNYQHIVKHIRYSNSLPSSQEIQRKFEVTFSAFNGLVRSNTFIINFDADVILALHQFTNSLSNDDILPFDLTSIPPELLSSLDVNDNDDKKEDVSVLMISLIAVVFAVIVLIPGVVIGCRMYRTNRSQTITVTSLNDPSKSGKHVSSVYFYDWRETPCIKINPSERISISNDPYSDLLKKPLLPETSTTDGSVYSDDEEMSDFDNDSIRQLEWDCLEKNLPNVLKSEEVYYFGK